MATITRTPRQIIVNALRALGVHGQNQDVDPEQFTDALDSFNELLEGVSSNSLLLPAPIQESFTLAAGTASYTIGSGATFNTDRPTRIRGGFIRDSANNDHRLTLMTREEFNQIFDKDAAIRPDRFYYNDTYPNGIIYFDSAPTAAETVYLDLQKSLGVITIAAIDTAVTIAPEYYKYLRFMLAVDIGPEYDVKTAKMNEVAALATRAERMLRILNTEAFVSEPDIGLVETIV